MPRRKIPAEDLASYRPGKHGARSEVRPAPTGAKIAPSHPIPQEVAAEFRRLLGLLGGRVLSVDATALTELAERVVQVRQLRKSLRSATPGELDYTRINAALTTTAAALDRLSREFGLTPLSRTSLPKMASTPGARSW